ncbi:MAG: galactokinase [Acidobacteriota bacterium]
MMMVTESQLAQRFRQEFQHTAPLSVRAPGRVNLLGEHTDYNDGFVFPAAIDREVSVLAARRSDDQVRAYSLDFSQWSTFNLKSFQSDREATWSNYLRGVVSEYQKRGLEVPGMDLMITGNVPIGAGLSSSAAVEVAIAEVIRVLGGLPIDKTDMAVLCQAAERGFVGVQCGIMDQFISTLAQKDTAMFLDCRDLSFSLIPLHFDAKIVVCDTRVQRALGSSEYNKKRAACEEAVRLLRPRLGNIRALRDVQLEQLNGNRSLLSELHYKAAHHVVAENERVLRGVELLRRTQVELFGELLYQSHQSLRDDYRVSCPELDLLVDLARKQTGTLGARMTGAGFGGCTVNLVRTGEVERFQKEVARGYEESTGREPFICVCVPSQGVTSTMIQGP